MAITKKAISLNISRKLGLSQKESLKLVNFFFSFIKENKNHDININNFGLFKYSNTPLRIGRNPKTLENFTIKPRKKLNFKASQNLKKILN